MSDISEPTAWNVLRTVFSLLVFFAWVTLAWFDESFVLDILWAGCGGYCFCCFLYSEEVIPS